MELLRNMYNFQTMFDILDDNANLTNLSAFPSRSSSTKKIQKKQNRPSLFQQAKPHNNQNREFDDLINGFLDKQSKFNNKNSDSGSLTTSKRGKFDSLDLNYDESSNVKPYSPVNSLAANSLGRPLNSKNYNSIDVNHENKFNNHFGKTQQTIINPSRIEESFVSSRQMKPPLKRRDNQSNMGENLFNTQIGMVIPQEDPTIANSSNKQDEEYSKPIRSINRRSSIDARSELNMDQSFTAKQGYFDDHISFKQDKVKEQPFEKMSNTESHIIGYGHNDTSFKYGSSFNKNETHNLAIKEKHQKDQQKSNLALNEKQINERISKISKNIIGDFEKQIDIMKETYQKQKDFLQENLDKQILQNKEMRDKFLKEANKMIDQQRSRSKRIHDQEVSRLKDIFQWQKNKIKEALKCEIESLKSVADYKDQNINRKSSYHQTFQSQNQQIKLKMWESSLQQKNKMLQRRQHELQQKISQLNSQKKQEDQKVRRQERRLMELEMNFKRQTLIQKKQISEQKQKMSAQLGNLELDIIKRKEANEMISRSNQIERQANEKEKDQLRRVNYEVVHSHKINMEEVQLERQKIRQLELQLLKKIRVVELKAKETYNLSRNNDEELEYGTRQDSSKIREKDRNYHLNRPISKQSNAKSMSNLLKTKQRFYQVEINARNKLNTSIKDHKKLDLGNYISRIQNYSKGKQ